MMGRRLEVKAAVLHITRGKTAELEMERELCEGFGKEQSHESNHNVPLRLPCSKNPFRLKYGSYLLYFLTGPLLDD